MLVIVKQYCISSGPALLLDIIEVDKPNEYMVKIEAEILPQGRVETRGVKPAQLCAHDLSFDRRDRELMIEKAVALYRTKEGEFFSIKFDGKKAVLKVLDIGKAKELYGKLSQKMLPEPSLFNPEAYQKDIAFINQANRDKKQAEKEEQEELEKYKESSVLYVKKGSSLAG